MEASSTESAILEVSGDYNNTDESSLGSLESQGHQTLQDLDNCTELIMETGLDIAVKVDAPLKQASMMETYVTYRVRCKCARWPTPTHTRRRYNHFKAFHSRLVSTYPMLAVPPLPATHTAREQLDRYGHSFVRDRTIGLNAFLNRVAHHPLMTHSEDLRLFVTESEAELERIYKSQSVGGSGLVNTISGLLFQNMSESVRVKDPEFASALDYLNSLQHKLKTLSGLTSRLYRGTASMSRDLVRSVGMSMILAHTNMAVRSDHAPLLMYSAAHVAVLADKIAQRNQIHAAYLSSNNDSELHNKLEQASEALRSELSQWNEHNRREIKATLLDIADKQLNMYSHSLSAWENAHRVCTSQDSNQDFFKTMSPRAVSNLSPSKCTDIGDEDEHKVALNGDMDPLSRHLADVQLSD